MDNIDNNGVDISDSGVEDSSSESEDFTDQLPDPVLMRSLPEMRYGRTPLHFDSDLPSQHSYLGSELEVVRGRTVLEEYSVVTLDLLNPADLVLVPGQTLPLTVFDMPSINLLRNCIRNDRTFGVIAGKYDEWNTTTSNIGTTAEIFEYLPEEGNSGFRVKAKARQRFKVLELDTDRSKAKVRILPEVQLPDPLEGVRLQSLNRFRSSQARKQRCRVLDASVTRWPAFVYKQYDIKRLVIDIKKGLNTSLLHFQNHKMRNKALVPVKVTIPNDPTDLSFWVAQNLPLKETDRMLLIKMNSPIQRLRWELKALLQSHYMLCCQCCSNKLGTTADVFSMSTEGPQGTYVNPGGFLHETVTLYKVRNVFSVGPPSTEFSWFPGYSWSICKCKHCNAHIGWKFMAASLELRPIIFWGVCRRSVAFKMESLRTNEDNNRFLVF